MRPIDHDQRRRHIIEKALALFAKHGYQSTSLTAIAAAGSCPRTMLYRYFKGKREIFNYAVSLLTQELAAKYADIEEAPGTCLSKLQRVMDYVTDSVFSHRVELSVILDYVLGSHRSGRSPRRAIARQSFGLRALLHRLIMAGIRRGEFRPVPVGIAVNLLYSQVESAILRITVADGADRRVATETIREILSWMRSA
ncbi:MAG: TetR/AcrR family transcriptional regulator [Kiritimatiellaeota bacterium]|nr:TetR/AcrR family transcriptional regulator [Kiritimatiellota bacterium]